jgi:hypothetical protein
MRQGAEHSTRCDPRLALSGCVLADWLLLVLAHPKSVQVVSIKQNNQECVAARRSSINLVMHVTLEYKRV